MPSGNYLSKNKASILYIKEILENNSSIEKPLSNAEIRKILSEYPYEIKLDRETVKSILQELAAYDDDLYRCSITDQEGRDGYSYGWYYNRSFSVYENIRDIIKDIYYNPAIPADYAKDKADQLMSLIPSSYASLSKKEINDLNVIPVRQNELSSEAYQNLKQIRDIIKDNRGNPKKEKYITFNFYKHVIKNKKHELEKMLSHFKEVLPLAIIEWNYHYWMICYVELTKKLGHFRVDLMCDIEVIERIKNKDPNKKKLIEKVNTTDAIRKYMNEHIFMGDVNGTRYIEEEKILSCTLKVKDSRQYGITYFYDIFKDNFTVIKQNDDYYLINVRCTKDAIERIVLSNIGLIEIVKPEDVKTDLAMKMRKSIEQTLINTNKALTNPSVIFNPEKLNIKVDDDEKWFYVNFKCITNPFEGKYRELLKCPEFAEYLKKLGFKEMNMKKVKDSEGNTVRMSRYLVTNKYESKEEIVDLIQAFAKRNSWFYAEILSYWICEYVYSYNKEKGRGFQRVYVYEGINSDMKGSFNYGSYLEKEYKRKNKDI